MEREGMHPFRRMFVSERPSNYQIERNDMTNENKKEEKSILKIDDDMFDTPRITIVGRDADTGGAGGNTITRLNKSGAKGAETIVINTDKQMLALVEADKKTTESQ